MPHTCRPNTGTRRNPRRASFDRSGNLNSIGADADPNSGCPVHGQCGDRRYIGRRNDASTYLHPIADSYAVPNVDASPDANRNPSAHRDVQARANSYTNPDTCPRL